MKTIFQLLIGLILVFTSIQTEAFGQSTKPRVVVMTDGEIDDRSSMVRFLLYSNEVEVEAIVQTNSVHQSHGRSRNKWLEKQLDAYEIVYPNLVVHDPLYPLPNELRSKVYVGDEDEQHLVVNNSSFLRIPGMEPQIDPSFWPDTPGSERILKVLLKDDPRSVFIQAWGGSNTLARALYKLKTNYKDQYDKAVSKVILYSIWYQDGAGNYIEKFHPKATILLSHYFFKTWAYGSQTFTFPFIKDVQNNYGPLGALYAQPYVSEGDSPSFLYVLQNGLRSHENPTYGGWGGRFYKVEGFQNVYRDNNEGDYLRWIEFANRDFLGRLSWCIAKKYEDANHYPIIHINGDLDRTVYSGEKVTIEAEVTDNESIKLSDITLLYPFLLDTEKNITKEELVQTVSKWKPVDIVWWQYNEAGTYKGIVPISTFDNNKIQFTAPVVNRPETIHIVIQATDRGKARLTTFARVIVTVNPTK